MTWVKLSDTFAEDPRLERAGPLALALHVVSLAYCNRALTDGHVPLSKMRRLLELDDPDEVAQTLVDVGMWSAHSVDGFVILDYLRDQPSRAHVESVRAKRAISGRKGGKRSGEARRRSTTEPTPKQSASRGLEPRPGGRSPQGRTCPDCRNPIAGDGSCACPPVPSVRADDPPPTLLGDQAATA